MKTLKKLENDNLRLSDFAHKKLLECFYPYFDKLELRCQRLIKRLYEMKGITLTEEQVCTIVDHAGGIQVVLPLQLGTKDCNLLQASKRDLETILDLAEGRPANILE